MKVSIKRFSLFKSLSSFSGHLSTRRLKSGLKDSKNESLINTKRRRENSSALRQKRSRVASKKTRPPAFKYPIHENTDGRNAEEE